MPSPLRIFVSSPGDVREERLRAQLVIAKLARDYAGLVAVVPYFWESEPLRASGHFQDEIDPPSHHDIVVLILWSRLGTPLPVRTALREYRGIDGRAPVTGTEWEFEDALAAFQANSTPDLLVYRRDGDPGASLTDAALRAEQERQWQALQAFWARHFENRGAFLAASARYDGLDAFDARLEADLAKLIERRIRAGAHLTCPWCGPPDTATSWPPRGRVVFRCWASPTRRRPQSCPAQGPQRSVGADFRLTPYRRGGKHQRRAHPVSLACVVVGCRARGRTGDQYAIRYTTPR